MITFSKARGEGSKSLRVFDPGNSSGAIPPGKQIPQMFYAKNIKGGANTVTVNLTAAAASSFEVYIHEYSGADTVSPLDAVSSATSNSGTAMDSGSATTHFANELIFGAGEAGSVQDAGPGFNKRSTLDNNITEDKSVTSSGAYKATETSGSGDAWIMAMATFKAAGSVLTLTAPLDSAVHVATGTPMSVYIGSNATTTQQGVHWITNPSMAGAYTISLGGTSGNSGNFLVQVVLPGIAPTLISYTQTSWDGTGYSGSSKSSASISWNAGDIIVVLAGTSSIGSGSMNTPTGTGISFGSMIAGYNPGNDSSHSGSGVWTANPSSGGSSAVTLDFGAVYAQAGFGVWVFRNASGVGLTAEQHTSGKTVSFTSAAHSAIVWGSFDFSAGASPAATPTSPTPDIREAAQFGQLSALVADIQNQLSTGAVSYGQTGGGSGDFSIVVLEIKGSGTSYFPAQIVAAQVAESLALTVNPTASSIKFVQSKFSTNTIADPAIDFASNNAAGDLIILALDWDNQSVTVNSITDTNGNTYVSAAGPVNGQGGLGSWRDQIFYAKTFLSKTGLTSV